MKNAINTEFLKRNLNKSLTLVEVLSSFSFTCSVASLEGAEGGGADRPG